MSYENVIISDEDLKTLMADSDEHSWLLSKQ